MHFYILRKSHLLVPLAGLALAVSVSGDPPNQPTWWDSSVITPGAPVNNKGPANIGQAKHMVSEALRALDTAAPAIATQIRADLAGTPPDFTDRLIDLNVPADPKPADWAEKQRAPLLIGQLKAISAPFYTRLQAVSPAWLTYERTGTGTDHPDSIFPWTTTTDDDANKALATIGQLKAVFSLRFEILSSPDFDTDADGISDFDEYRLGTNPTIPRIWAFKKVSNTDGTVTFTWNSYATNGSWFNIESEQPDGTWEAVYSTNYGSPELPFVLGSHAYSLTLNPATDYQQ